MPIDCNETLKEWEVFHNGYHINENGGIYRNGASYKNKKRVKVRDVYIRWSLWLTHQPNISEIAHDCAVLRMFVCKIEHNLLSLGGQMTLRKEVKEQDVCARTQPGCSILKPAHYRLIYELYLSKPSRTVQNFCDNILFTTGTQINCTTMRRILHKAFPFRANLCCANGIPVDKFGPDNLLRAREFVELVSKFLLSALKCVDEKLLKNSEAVIRKTWHNPMTGEVPPILTNDDFQNTYKVLGICEIDERVLPIFFKIHKESNDSSQYNDFILEVNILIILILLLTK